jgi:osmoprotectant transport system permease protein
MSRYFSINKVPFCASALGLAAILFSGFVTFRPNRIAVGKAVFLSQTLGNIWIGVAILWVVLFLVSALRIPGRTYLLFTGLLSSTLILLLIATAARHASLTTQDAGSIARTSLGPAFWTLLFALIVILTDTWQRSDREKSLITFMGIITGGILLGMLVSGNLDMLSIMREFANRKERFFGELLTHLALVGSSVGLALGLGIPLGLLAHRKKRLYTPTFFALNTLQTMPSLALFGILIPVLAAVTLKFPVLTDMGIKGIGAAPAIIALTVYSLLPVARNTYIGFTTVDPAAIEAGTGMGMTRSQLLFRVEIPIASPVILNGIRVALVQAIGLTAVAALIGAGGLGVFIFQGLGQAANDLILLGAIPTIFIAVVVDSFMGVIIRILQPKGLR